MKIESFVIVVLAKLIPSAALVQITYPISN